jgi:hypothetical protein
MLLPTSMPSSSRVAWDEASQPSLWTEEHINGAYH